MNSRRHVSASSLRTLRQCRRLYYYRYVCRLTKDADATPLRMGAVWHLAMQARNNGVSCEDAVQAVHEHYVECACPDHLPQHDWDVERETMKALVAGYCEHYAEDDVIVGESEVEFERSIRNPETGAPSPIYYRLGYVDGKAELDGSPVIVEYKLVGQNIEEDLWWQTLRYDPQITSYAHAFEINNILYDATRKPTISPKQIPILDADGFKIVQNASGERVFKKNGEPRQSGSTKDGFVLLTEIETPEQWAERLAEDISSRPEYYYQRREIPRLHDDLKEYEYDLWQQIHVLREAEKTGWWYREVDRFRCKNCEMVGLCFSGQHIEPGTVPDGYITRKERSKEDAETSNEEGQRRDV